MHIPLTGLFNLPFLYFSLVAMEMEPSLLDCLVVVAAVPALIPNLRVVEEDSSKAATADVAADCRA